VADHDKVHVLDLLPEGVQPLLVGVEAIGRVDLDAPGLELGMVLAHEAYGLLPPGGVDAHEGDQLIGVRVRRLEYPVVELLHTHLRLLHRAEIQGKYHRSIDPALLHVLHEELGSDLGGGEVLQLVPVHVQELGHGQPRLQVGVDYDIGVHGPQPHVDVGIDDHRPIESNMG
jgi:hypothetical protein